MSASAGLYSAILYPVLTACLYYLGSRAIITRWLWSRYPSWLDRYMLCSACSGFAYGVAVSLGIGRCFDVPFLMFPGRLWITPLIVGLFSIVMTPVVADKHLAALDQTSPPNPMENEGKDGHQA